MVSSSVAMSAKVLSASLFPICAIGIDNVDRWGRDKNAWTVPHLKLVTMQTTIIRKLVAFLQLEMRLPMVVIVFFCVVLDGWTMDRFGTSLKKGCRSIPSCESISSFGKWTCRCRLWIPKHLGHMSKERFVGMPCLPIAKNFGTFLEKMKMSEEQFS